MMPEPDDKSAPPEADFVTSGGYRQRPVSPRTGSEKLYDFCCELEVRFYFLRCKIKRLVRRVGRREYRAGAWGGGV